MVIINQKSKGKGQKLFEFILSPKRVVFFAITAVIFTSFAFVKIQKNVHAATGINRTINFQGKVVNSNGTNVADGQYSFVFRIYDVSSGGTHLWTETQNNVQVTAGVFRVALGSVSSISGVDFNTDSLYLGINFNSDGEMTPRIRFASVPYAFNAEKVAGLTVTDTTGTLTIPNSKTVQFGGAFTTSAHDLSFTMSGGTTLTLPTTGTLATLGGTENLSNKTFTTSITTSGVATDFTTASNENLTISPNGTGNVLIQTGAGGQAALVVDKTGLGDIFAASSSGVSKFVIKSDGTASSSAGFTVDGVGSVQSTNNQTLTVGGGSTGNLIIGRTSQAVTLPGFDCSAQGNGGKLTTTSGGVLTCSADTSGGGSGSNWVLSSSDGTLSPINNTLDLLVGSTSSSSAEFSVRGIAAGTNPTASISATTGSNNGNGIVISGDGTIQSLRNNSLILGGNTSGNLILKSNNLVVFRNPGATNTFVGETAGNGLGAGTDNTFTGYQAGYNIGDGINNSFYGSLAGLNTYGNSNAFFGANSGRTNAAGTQNAFFGYSSGYANSSGNQNSFFGYESGRYTTGGTNSFFGFRSGYSNNGGTGNTFFGYSAGESPNASNANVSGTNNTFVGYESGPGSTTQLTNASAFGYRAQVTASNALVLGGTGAEAVSVGIGTTTPKGVLDIQGGFMGANAALIINQTGVSTNDILAASASGTTKFVIKNDGTASSSAGFTVNGIGSIQSTNYQTLTVGGGSTGNLVIGRTSQAVTLPGFDCSALGNGGKLTTTSGGVLTCSADTSGGGGGSNWVLSSSDGTLIPINNTLDILVGGTSTQSAVFSILGVAAGTNPSASVSATQGANAGKGIYMSGDGSLQSVNNNYLTLGGNTTGDIYLRPLNSTGMVRLIHGNTGSGGLMLGDSESDNVAKSARIKSYGYTGSTPITMMVASNTNGTNLLNIGGGSGTEYSVSAINFYTAKTSSTATGTQRMRIDPDGYIGIGTSTPRATLDVRGALSESAEGGTLPVASISGRTSHAALVVDNTLGDLITASSSGLKRFTIEQSGNVLIGTGSATEKLTVNQGNVLVKPGDPKVKGTVAITNANSVAISGKYAYVGSLTGNFVKVVDISNPSSPTVIGTITDSTNLATLRAVAVSGKYVYATKTNRLSIIDVSNAANPTLTGTISSSQIPGGVTKLYVSGNYVYITAPSTLAIVDVTEPTSPTVASSVNLTSINGVFVVGKYAYVAGNNTLKVVDISDPYFPAIVGTLTDTTNLASSTDIYVSGRYAYVTTNGANDRLTVVDIANPYSPTYAGTITDTNYLDGAGTVKVSGNYAYVYAGTSRRLSIIDISNPSALTFVSSFYDSTNFNGTGEMVISGKYAYVVALSAGSLSVVDINGIDAPAANIGSLFSNTINTSENVDIGNNLYVQNGVNVGAGGIFSNGSLTLQSSQSAQLYVSGTNNGHALVILNQTGANNILTASASGITKFTIKNDGTASTSAGLTVDGVGSIQSTNNQTLTVGGGSTGNLIIGRSSQAVSLPGFDCSALDNGGKLTTTSGGVLTCSADTSGAGGSSPFDALSTGVIAQGNNTLDLLIGGTSTASAKFAVLNIDGTGTPVASVSAIGGANDTKGIYLSGDGSLQSVRNNTLTIGGSTTGNISLMPNGGNGYVGIGTASPNYSLDVVQNVSSGSVIKVTNTNTGTGAYQGVFVAESVGSNQAGVMAYFPSTYSGAGLATANTFGIYTSSGATNGLFLGTQGNGPLKFATGGISNTSFERMRITSTGEFGFGTSTPLASFDVRAQGTNKGTIAVASVSGATSFAALAVDNSGTGDIFTASSSGLNRFVIKQDGKVGVGTNTPSYALELQGNTNSAHALFITNVNTGSSATQQLILGESISGGRYLQLAFLPSTYSGSGLSVANSAHLIAASAATAGLVIQNQAALAPIIFSTGGVNSEKMRLISSGQLGIGTTTPTGGIHVRANFGNNAGAIIDQINNDSDLITASASGITKFTIKNDGTASSSAGFTIDAAGGFTTTNSNMLSLGTGDSGDLLIGRTGKNILFGSTTFANCSALETVNGILGCGTDDIGGGGGANFWQYDSSTGIVANGNLTTDLLLGSTSSSSAKFAVLGIAAGTNPTASVSATSGSNLGKGLSIDGSGRIQSFANNTMYIGGSTTGEIHIEDSLYLGVDELTNGGLTFYSSGVGITDPSITADASGNLILSAPSGTVQIGDGTGNITLSLEAVGDVFIADKTVTLSTNYSTDDFTFKRVLTGGANNQSGAVLKITDISGGSGAITTDMLHIDAALTSGNFRGTLGRFQQSGVDKLRIYGNGTLPVATISANTSFAAMVVDNTGLGDLFTASKSGATKFTVTNAGNLIAANYATCTLKTDSSGLFTCGTDNTGGGGSNWVLTSANGTLSPINNTLDILVGGTSTQSAVFSILGVAAGTNPSASVSATQGANAGKGIYMSGDGSLQSVRNNNLTIGGNTTGDIYLRPLNSTGMVKLIHGNTGLGGLMLGDSESDSVAKTSRIKSYPYSGSTPATMMIASNQADSHRLFIGGGSASEYSVSVINFYTAKTTSTLAGTVRMRIDADGYIAIGHSIPRATLDVRNALTDSAEGGTLPVASISGRTSFAGLVVDNSLGDLFTASSSGMTRFTIQQSGTVVIGSSSNGLTFDYLDGNTGMYRGSARPTKKITLSPEFDGGVLTASGSATTNGSMTTDASHSAQFRTYYEWTSTQTTPQDYTVAVRVTLPADFSDWATGNTMTISYNTAATSSTPNGLDIYMYNPGDSTSLPVYFSTGNVSGVAKTWTTVNLTSGQLDNNASPDWDAAGETVTIYLKMKASGTHNYTQLGDIVINYLAKF